MNDIDSVKDEMPEPITCPVCKEIVDGPIENELSEDQKTWVYFETVCHNCRTQFRIGEVTDKCHLCHQTFPSEPYFDVNERIHHWCKTDNQEYCTPCFMQLFFDGYVDISSDREDIDDENFLGLEICTNLGTIAPYKSRLATKGYELARSTQEWDQAKQLCKQLVRDNHRYLLFGTDGEQAGTKEYLIYRNILEHQQ
jgi:hypothetical protein